MENQKNLVEITSPLEEREELEELWEGLPTQLKRNLGIRRKMEKQTNLVEITPPLEEREELEELWEGLKEKKTTRRGVVPRRGKVRQMIFGEIISKMLSTSKKPSIRAERLAEISKADYRRTVEAERLIKIAEADYQRTVEAERLTEISKADYQKRLTEISKADYQRTVEAERLTEISKADYQRTVEEKCKLCLSLFLLDREFDKDQMVQLWVAEGIFASEVEERMEALGGTIFDSMVETKLISPSRFDNVYGLLKYRVVTNMTSLVDFHDEAAKTILPSDDDYLVVDESQLGNPSKKLTKHLSIICENFSLRTAEVLKDFKDLCTLILFCESGTLVNHLPHDLFLYLKHLRTLDLHEFSSISELPNSIENLKSLRYLDVSDTAIIYLPESVDSLYLLQTLKLKGCLELQRLPKNMRHLICLRHLDLDIIGQLNSMPKGMGSLTRLQTLRAFLVGREDGCRVRELKNLVNLTGSFCISRLENISNSDEAREAELSNKKCLSKLQLRWDGRHRDGSDAEDEILECLQPHFGIKELEILFFNGTKLPTWISNSSFTEIVSISLFQCRNCSLLPSIGRLPSLKFLEIYEMNGLRFIDHSFCRNEEGQEFEAFPKLEKLTLDGMLNLEEWTGIGDGDFLSLQQFKLKYCPKLSAVRFLSKLQSLKFLEIIECTVLQSFSEDVLPASLETLIVKDCPRVKESFANHNAQDWSKIAHVRSLFLDHEEICPKKLVTEHLNS